jgi:hypothetical protein
MFILFSRLLTVGYSQLNIHIFSKEINNIENNIDMLNMSLDFHTGEIDNNYSIRYFHLKEIMNKKLINHENML